MTARDKVIAVGIALALTVLGMAAILEPFYDKPQRIIQKGEEGYEQGSSDR